MKKASFQLLNRKRVLGISVVLLMMLQVVIIPTVVGPSSIEANYGTAQELDAFFQSVNQRNDEVNETVIEELNFLRSLHDGSELAVSLLDTRKAAMNDKDESEDVIADISDYETVTYDYSERGLEPTDVNDLEPTRADIIETMLSETDFYQDSFLSTVSSIFVETYLIYWAYDANGNGAIDVSGCEDGAPPEDPCEEGVEEANLVSTLWGASTALIAAWIESLGLDNNVADFIISFINILDESDTAWIPIDIDEDGGNEIRARLVPVVNDLLNEDTDVNPLDGDVGLEANLGLNFEFEKLEELNQTLDIAIVRGITYNDENEDDLTYVWGVNSQFPPNEIPDEYSLSVVIEEFVFTIGTEGGGIGLNPGDVDYVNAPYQINVLMNNDTGDPSNNGIDNLEIAIGYLKYNWSSGTVINPGDALEEITFIKIDLENPRGKVPRELGIRLVSQNTDGVDRDSIEVYAPATETTNSNETNKKFNLGFQYYEYNLNPGDDLDPFLSHIEAYITGVPVCKVDESGDEICLNELNMPKASLWLEVRNESTSDKNWTVIEFHSTEPIESIVYGDYEYYTEDGRGATWLDHDYQLFTGLEITDLPESFVLEGNLQLDESGRSSIPVNDDVTSIDSSLVGGLISDLLIGLAGRIIYVGDLLRSIPKAVLQSTIGEGDGEVAMRLRTRQNELAYISEIFVYLTSDKYLALNDGSEDDYFAIYNESAYLDNNAPNSRSSISLKNEDYSFSARITDIGDIDFYSREGITNISLSMNPIRDKPFRVYFEGIDDVGETSHWANITLSNIPTNITLNIDNGNLVYAGGNSANEIIDNIIFTSLASGIYSRLKLEHLPGSAEIVSSGGDLRLITDSWFNFTFTITNVTENEKATSWVWNHSDYNGSSVMLYQNNMGMENETASLSGNLSWIQSLRLDDDGSGELANFKINHKQPVQFKVGAIDDTEYEDDYKGLDAYVFIDSLPAEIIVTVPILDSQSIISGGASEINDLRDVARFIEALSEIGKALVNTVADLSINLVTNVESFETVARFLYNINEEVSVTAWVNKGKIELLDESPRWVEGLWSSQKNVEGGTILGARLLLKGLPQSVDANYTSKGDKIDLQLSLEDFNYRDTADYLIFQEEGIIGPKVTVFIEEIPVGLDLDLNANLILNATVENLTLSGSISMNTSQPVGPIYLVLEQFEEDNPYRVEAFISSLPGSMTIDMEIHEDLLEFNISSDQGIDTVALEIDLGDSAELETYWTEGISLDMSDDGAMNMKAYLRGISPNFGIKLWDPEDKGAQLDISLEDFNHDVPAMNRILVDINNFENKSVLLRIDDLPNNFDLNASVYLDDKGMEGTALVGNISLESSKELGSIYAMVSDKQSQSQLEIAVPDVPEKINLEVVIGDEISVDFSSSSAPSRVILSLKSGNLTGMDLTWTHGIVLRQNDFGDALLLYLEGTVTSAKLSTAFGEPDIINLNLGDWSPITKWIYLDLDRGINETAIELFLDEVGDNNNIDAYFQTGKSEGRDLDAIFDIHQTGGIGSSYLKTHNQTRPSFNEIYFSKIPKDLRADLIVGKEIDIIYEAEGTLDYIWVKTANKDYGQWRSAQAIVHDVPESFHMGIDPNYEFDMDLAFAFQGFPNLFVSTSSSEIDVLLMVDEGYTGGHSGTFMEVINVGDNTSMILDGVNYIIDSPNGIDSAYLRATNSPTTSQFYLDYMVIHAKDVKHVEIIPNQLFGLYPIFELANAEGGELSFAIGGELSIGPIKLKTSVVLMDLRIKEVGGHNILPTWLGVQKNGIDTELGNNEKHYILPEPGMSLIASLEASI
ncbi:MAG: hypothetical protein CXT75_04160 [Methanobacteriota archaeon]|jgi:hypothetical protein|uniref:Uncharacterized protein n=1 Tax=Marine Group III euryarchaeote TaxID=2173149 RepID=A0A7J4GSC3_9ARCH|nr:MAG: hypothetical protein CXT75_04160 [Euryarchaeota archaeon]HIF37533.1 hypothetical protein [Marine Group III euryarchaeote]